METEFLQLIDGAEHSFSDEALDIVFNKILSLLDRGLNLNSRLGRESKPYTTIFEKLHRYIGESRKCPEYLSILVEQHGAQPTTMNLLMDLVYFNCKSFQFLIEHGANPNECIFVKDYIGIDCLLEYAYLLDQLDSFELLLQYGADPQLMNENLRTEIFNNTSKKSFRDLIIAYSGGKALKAVAE